DGPGDAEQPAAVQDRAPAAHEVLGRRLGRDRADAPPVRRQLFRQDRADLGPERLGLGRIGHVHDGSKALPTTRLISYIILLLQVVGPVEGACGSGSIPSTTSSG